VRHVVAAGRIRKIDGHAVWEGVRYDVGGEGIQIINTTNHGRVTRLG
jgi:hypothetical protein